MQNCYVNDVDLNSGVSDNQKKKWYAHVSLHDSKIIDV